MFIDRRANPNRHKAKMKVMGRREDNIIRAVARLYFIHIFACLAVALSIYFPGLDILLSVLYLICIGLEAYSEKAHRQFQIVTIILLWQLPGVGLSLMSIAPVGIWGQANYAFFVLEFWYTPILPLLSTLSGFSPGGKPLYYYLLLYAPLIMALYYYLVALVRESVDHDKPFTGLC